ncbi:PH domain-containing protein [Streptomyces camelliae]|uniref:PH domain-containing protein n=1 Tax=Streptomyces camelliae TaxID=3004093 RepID=A0ABY7PDJ8_9ACTN|nr:PH domain-containing protein [Streptomyces sp. HUAS 2-6]WBO68671.1 PH domain-containing protein [Streptomyces sp. HUAS 2-6]
MGDERVGQLRFEAPYRYRRSGRRILIVSSAALVGVIAFIDATATDGRDPAWIVISAIGVIGACFYFAAFVGPLCGSTTVDAKGLTTRTLLRTRVVTWQEVQSFRFSRSNRLHLVRAQLYKGRPLTLPGLVAENAGDPELSSRLDELAAWITALADAATEQSG